MLQKYVGNKLYGYCNGFFGRDSYREKIVVFAGKHYIVCEDASGDVYVASFKGYSEDEISEFINSWREEDLCDYDEES